MSAHDDRFELLRAVMAQYVEAAESPDLGWLVAHGGDIEAGAEGVLGLDLGCSFDR